MASHKSLSINAPVKSTPSYVRQSLSATRVIHLLNAESPERLPPLPLVPYALSMALSVVYRHFRSRRLKVHINRATEELKQCVQLLDRLRNAWWSAGTMADIGRAVLSNAAGRTTTTNNTNAANTPAPSAPEARQQDSKTEAPPAHTHGTAGPRMPTSRPWSQQHMDSPIDPRLQPSAPPTPMTHLLNPMPGPGSGAAGTLTPGTHPTSSERGERAPAAPTATATAASTSASAAAAAAAAAGFGGFAETSPDWLNFDAAFENFEGLLGSSGADLSNELFRPLNYETLEGFLDPAA
jgi:hypothetical protein